MNGKALKEWASTIPDEAVIEFDHYNWDELPPEKIRAVMRPAVTVIEGPKVYGGLSPHSDTEDEIERLVNIAEARTKL